jgi:hypothetical protein
MGTETVEARGILQIVDDLPQLRLGLIDAGDVGPDDIWRLLRLDLGGLRARNQPHRHENEPDERQHQQQRHPVMDERDYVCVTEKCSMEHGQLLPSSAAARVS